MKVFYFIYYIYISDINASYSINDNLTHWFSRIPTNYILVTAYSETSCKIPLVFGQVYILRNSFENLRNTKIMK